jgi:hypothetical protein
MRFLGVQTIKIMQKETLGGSGRFPPFFSSECRNDDASGEAGAIGSNSNVIRRNGSSESHAHGVVQAVIHSKVASQGTAVANVHNADMVMA